MVGLSVLVHGRALWALDTHGSSKALIIRYSSFASYSKKCLAQLAVVGVVRRLKDIFDQCTGKLVPLIWSVAADSLN